MQAMLFKECAKLLGASGKLRVSAFASGDLKKSDLYKDVTTPPAVPARIAPGGNAGRKEKEAREKLSWQKHSWLIAI